MAKRVFPGFCFFLLLAACTPKAPERPTQPPEIPPAQQTGSTAASEPADSPTVVAENLAIPWAIAFLPSGDVLVTERPGTLLRIADESSDSYPIAGVHHVGEGGLLGLTLHPDFASNRFIYLYLTTNDGGSVTNRVERYRFGQDELTDRQVIIENIPGAVYHDGGRIAFGPDGSLYITTGDAGNGQNAQNTDSLAGKILRLNDDGSIPPDNPFGNAVYSYGHRNPQGLAWDNEEQLWSTEHGRSGLRSGYDELNRIESGGNYGWPEIQGDETREGMIAPALHSSPSVTWAPASLAYWNGQLFFGGLRGQTLYAVDPQSLQLTEHFATTYGRLREVTVGPDNSLYFTTSNRDGRGDPAANDDKIIKINTSSGR